MTEHRILAEFVVKGASSPSHAEKWIRDLLDEKHITNNAMFPREVYIFERPKEWTLP
jgi:hypothetical protein